MQSLLEKSRSGDRVKWVEEMRQQIPEIEVLPSVCGFDQDEVLGELRNAGLAYHGLAFKNYGVLACWLTKFKGFQMQVDQQIPAACWLEDDLLLGHTFETGEFAKDFILRTSKDIDPTCNILRYGGWGECYVTFLDGAKRLVEKLRTDGIRGNVDNQLNWCGEKHIPGFSYRLKCWSNWGDTLKGKEIEESLRADFAG